MTPSPAQIASELRERIAVLQREAKNADDEDNITAKSCEHTAQELSRFLYWIDGAST